MKSMLILAVALLSPIASNSQAEIDGKPLDSLQKEIVKQAFSKEKLLGKAAGNCCTCIDSIQIADRDAKTNAGEIKKCIDKEVLAYQTSLTLAKAADVNSGDKMTFPIFTDPNSREYKQFYFEIERQLMDSCKSIRGVVGMNNVEKPKSVSQNAQAIREYNKGNEYLRNNDYASALPFYVKAVGNDPEFVFAWDNIGVCSRKLGSYDAAIAAYRKSLKLDPTGMTALQNLPLAYIGKKDYKTAIACYKDLARVDPQNPEVFYGIGVLYLENLQDYEGALDNLCKAYKIYVIQGSPYRTDAEKAIQMVYDHYKKLGKEETFTKILKQNNINPN
ncbi:MAG: tetratricopeptide repeat protein [Flavobacterium sp.]|nr:MAG: tetratricopeptide repeat protein [Flavobacterium sp.]